MRTQLLSLTNVNTNKLFFNNNLPELSTNQIDRIQMKQILSKAIYNELTAMQRLCIVEHFFNNKKQKEIADELGVNASTVSRHIKKGKKKLKNIASYYTNT